MIDKDVNTSIILTETINQYIDPDTKIEMSAMRDGYHDAYYRTFDKWVTIFQKKYNIKYGSGQLA